MNVLVTGGGGTLGCYVLRELLHAGHAVTCYSRTAAPPVEGIDFVAGDIMDPDCLAQACRGRDAVVHLAAVPGPRRATPERLLAVNVLGTVHVLEAAVRHGIGKVVFASSGAAAGFTFARQPLVPRYFPVDEEHPAEPQDEYGLSKLLGEITCKRYSDAYGLRTPCLRVNNNWYLDREGAEVAVRCGWARGLTVEELWTIRYRRSIEDAEADWPTPGPPSPRNNLWAVTDARDAAQAFRLALEDRRPGHEVYFVNGDDTCSEVETRALVARHYPGVPLKALLEGHASLVSHEKATRLLGYRPRYTWRRGDFRTWLDSQRRARASPAAAALPERSP
jgi:nucleoside-diphosphate-sugar epimerase